MYAGASLGRSTSITYRDLGVLLLVEYLQEQLNLVVWDTCRERAFGLG